MSDCNCPDWKPNVDRINGYIVTAAARSGFRDQYDGKPFVYCPWCAQRLGLIDHMPSGQNHES